jgi:phosphoglycerate dehydrogenase-like enzyme
VGEKELRRMKPSSVLINTSRGPVLDEKALEKALTLGWIAAAGIDVFENEPPDPKSPLLKQSNITMTPHSAAFTAEATKALWLACIAAVIAVLKSERPPPPANILNPDVAGISK